VEAPLIPVCKEPVPKRWGLLSRIFCTGLISGTKAPLEPVLISIFPLVRCISPPSSGPLPGRRLLYKVPFPLDQHLRGICLLIGSDLFVVERLARWLVEARRGWCHAGLLPLSTLSGPRCFWQSICWRVFSSSPARASDDEDVSRPLAQPALWSKPASSAGRRGDPWDACRQMALPLAYPDRHPHDTASPPLPGGPRHGNHALPATSLPLFLPHRFSCQFLPGKARMMPMAADLPRLATSLGMHGFLFVPVALLTADGVPAMASSCMHDVAMGPHLCWFMSGRVYTIFGGDRIGGSGWGVAGLLSTHCGVLDRSNVLFCRLMLMRPVHKRKWRRMFDPDTPASISGSLQHVHRCR
jgi:hypothetical protein